LNYEIGTDFKKTTIHITVFVTQKKSATAYFC